MDIINTYNDLVSYRKFLKKQKINLRNKKRKLEKQNAFYIETRSILNEAIKTIHQKFKSEIESIVTLAIKEVFNRDLSLKLTYEEKRNGIQTIISIEENGEQLDPKDEMGGSIVNIISFAFRIILWHMSPDRKRNVFILDEPFHFCGSLSEIAGIVLKDLSVKLNFQVILTTHDNNLIKIADKIFSVINKNGKSTIVPRRKVNGN
jgi:DNA repair exonuclease SbcCD ATPase subunit